MQPELREGEAQRLRDLERAKLLTWLDGDAPFPGRYAVASVLDALAASQERERQLREAGNRLASDVSELIAAAPAEWDGGDLGYLVDGVSHSVEKWRALDSTQTHAAPEREKLERMLDDTADELNAVADERRKLFVTARELHRDLAKLWIGGDFPRGVYDSWRGLGTALGEASPLTALQEQKADSTQTHGGSDE